MASASKLPKLPRGKGPPAKRPAAALGSDEAEPKKKRVRLVSNGRPVRPESAREGDDAGEDREGEEEAAGQGSGGDAAVVVMEPSEPSSASEGPAEELSDPAQIRAAEDRAHTPMQKKEWTLPLASVEKLLKLARGL